MRAKSKSGPMVHIEPQSSRHAPGLFAALSDERTYTFLDERPPTSVEAVRERIERLREGAPAGRGETWLNWTVFEDGAIVGYTQATVAADGTADLAFVLHPDAWGRSVGLRACRLTLDALLSDPVVRRVVADTNVANGRSRELLDRLGFRQVDVEGADVFYELGEPQRGA